MPTFFMLREEGKLNVNAYSHVSGVLDKHPLKDVHYVHHRTAGFEPWTSRVETRSKFPYASFLL